jgi:hypothetical protein
MLLIASSLALLVVYAGVKLLIQSGKEALGRPYQCGAWCFIIAGFLILACSGICCIAKCCRYGQHMMMMKEHMLMKRDHSWERDMREDHHEKMMRHHHHGEEACMEEMICCPEHMVKCYVFKGEDCKTDTTWKHK